MSNYAISEHITTFEGNGWLGKYLQDHPRTEEVVKLNLTQIFVGPEAALFCWTGNQYKGIAADEEGLEDLLKRIRDGSTEVNRRHFADYFEPPLQELVCPEVPAIGRVVMGGEGVAIINLEGYDPGGIEIKEKGLQLILEEVKKLKL